MFLRRLSNTDALCHINREIIRVCSRAVAGRCFTSDLPDYLVNNTTDQDQDNGRPIPEKIFGIAKAEKVHEYELWKGPRDAGDDEYVDRFETRERFEHFRIPAVKVRFPNADGSFSAKGARKRAKAYATLAPVKNAEAGISINKRSLADYFPISRMRRTAISPLILTRTAADYTIDVRVRGGGKSGQAQAVRHAIASCLRHLQPWHRPLLKKYKYLTRDPRIVQPKNIGQPKARKKKQWVRR